jgi:5'-nucleotidase
LSPKLDEVWKSPGFFLELKPIPGALEAVAEIAELNDAAICSRCFLDSPTCESEKKAGVRKYMGREWVKRLILVRDKTRIKGEILIDDCYPQEGIYKPEWEQVLYTHPWNEKLTGIRRITWQNWKRVLPELASD